ncbi:glycosyl transferase family 90 [Paracoccus sp. MC1862]|uniref:glycosyl transferase family 90 n=1 Tax=Paracoccus sp. MC1862 TaxID=2760307 RepID=UPI001603E79E|nr:glycosyl transferase family 90 [Paracoccus sp. MC1862]MBB1499004.1 hypothetical protein [Paracoccus sp. MC1862]QQO44641.1 hypothetical protein JGR78_15080 [Paracoccus sp. MC1862]
MTAAVDDAEFVRIQVAHRLGSIGNIRLKSTEATRQRLERSCSGSALVWNAGEGRPAAWNGWDSVGCDVDSIRLNGRSPERAPKYFRALKEVLAAGADFDFAMDMQDRRVRSPVVSEGPDAGCAVPVFVFNRLESVAGAVLWPLPLYHDLGSDGFLGNFDQHRIPWEMKGPRFVWRGSPGGRNSIGKPSEHAADTRMRPLLQRHRDGRISDGNLRAQLDLFPRYRFVSRYIGDVRGDVGFTERKDIGIDNWPALRPLKLEAIPQREMLRFKYLVVLPGLDIGSSFFWTMNSGSVGLVMETPFESFASVHFKPWEHYVPFRQDLSDFEDRLAWCRKNDAECREMTERAAAVCRQLGRTDLRHQCNMLVIEEVRRRIERSDDFSSEMPDTSGKG